MVAMLSVVLAWPPWAVVTTVLEGAAPGHEQVSILRRWQAVYGLQAPDLLTLGSLGRLVFLLGEHAAILRSPEYVSLPAHTRPERMAESRLTTRGAAQPAGADAVAQPRAGGPPRFDTRSLTALMAYGPYLDQKRVILALIRADDPLSAVRVCLTGEIPRDTAPPGAVTATAPAPAPDSSPS